MEFATPAKKKELMQSEKDPLSKAKEAFRTKVRIEQTDTLVYFD